MLLTRCDQCGTTATPADDLDWILVSILPAVSFGGPHPDDDDAGEPTLHFCTWSCAATYTSARALVDTP